MEKTTTKIFIIDDELKSNHPILIKLGQVYNDVKLYKKA